MARPNAWKGRPQQSMLGLELAKCLTARSIRAADLARMMARRKTPITAQYIGYLLHGKRQVTPITLNNISAAMQLSEPEAQVLHRAAAIEAGFRIGG